MVPTWYRQSAGAKLDELDELYERGRRGAQGITRKVRGALAFLLCLLVWGCSPDEHSPLRFVGELLGVTLDPDDCTLDARSMPASEESDAYDRLYISCHGYVAIDFGIVGGSEAESQAWIGLQRAGEVAR